MDTGSAPTVLAACGIQHNLILGGFYDSYHFFLALRSGVMPTMSGTFMLTYITLTFSEVSFYCSLRLPDSFLHIPGFPVPPALPHNSQRTCRRTGVHLLEEPISWPGFHFNINLKARKPLQPVSRSGLLANGKGQLIRHNNLCFRSSHPPQRG